MNPFFSKRQAAAPPSAVAGPPLAAAVATMSRNLAATDGGLGEIRLPPLDSGSLTPEGMRALASLYFQAEVEQTGLIALAEALAVNRREIGLQSVEAARKLEEFTESARRWPTAAQRQDIYGRLFQNNHEFQRLLANLCASLMLISREFDLGRRMRVTDEAHLRQVARSLVSNLARVHSGSVTLGGQAIARQLQASIEILRHPGILAHFAARDLWGVIRAVFQGQTPDLDRHLSRGRSGLQVLTWLSGIQHSLRDDPPQRPTVAPRDPVLVWAASWLQASNFGGQ